MFNLGYTKTRTTRIRLYKARNAQAFSNLPFVIGSNVVAFAHHYRVRDVQFGESTQEVVKRKLIESECFNQNVACRVGHTDKIEVALHNTILARSAMNGNIGKVKVVAFAISRVKWEVIAIDEALLLSVKYGPISTSFDFYNVAVILFVVHKGQNTLCRTQRNIVLRGVTSSHNSNFTFHCYIC